MVSASLGTQDLKELSCTNQLILLPTIRVNVLKVLHTPSGPSFPGSPGRCPKGSACGSR